MAAIRVSRYVSTGDRTDYGVEVREEGNPPRMMRVALTGSVLGTMARFEDWVLDGFMDEVAERLAKVPSIGSETDAWQFNAWQFSTENCGNSDPPTILKDLEDDPTRFIWTNYPTIETA